MGPFKDWDPVVGLPDTLEKLLKETEINNSFVESAVIDTVKDTMESSYAYLYRMQRDSVNYHRFHFQTREFLLNTTYNDIQKGLKYYGDLLKELESAETPDAEKIAETKRTLAEFGEVRFGDLYLDEKRQVSINIDHDMIYPEVKELFRNSSFYRTDIDSYTISSNKEYFREIPIVIVDGEVKTNIKIRNLEQGTKIILSDMTAKDVYTNIESQKFHDICILCIPNVVISYSKIAKDVLLSGKFSFSESVKYKNGLFFISIKNDSHATGLIPAKLEDGRLAFTISSKASSIINASENTGLDVAIFFFQDLRKYEFSIESDGTVPSKKRIYVTEEEYKEVAESAYFIPSIDGEILPVPIPEENMLVFKSVYNGTTIDRYEPSYNCGVTLHYPNMYQVSDPEETLKDKYEIYFFYKEVNDARYTPLFDFYWEYLRSRFNEIYSIEEVINKIYFKENGYNINQTISPDESNPDILNKRVLENEMLEAFYTLFEKMLEYKDYKYHYGTPDFISEYQGDDIPLQYKIARMMEFIKADWKVLPNYVKTARHKESLFHFFTNTINLSGRFRRSTRLEEKETTPFLFAKGAKFTTETNPNALIVSDKKNYDRDQEIYLDDIKLLLPTAQSGDYVELTDLTNRYVFAFKNPGKVFLGMKVFIDGILCSDVVTINSLGTDYLYLPTSMVNENSYIMMELEWATEEAQIEEVTFANATEWKTIHLIESPNVEYTMNDVVLKVNGKTLEEDIYTAKLVRNEVSYSMEDERHGTVNKYGIVTDVKLQLTNVALEFPITVEVCINKSFFMTYGVADRNGYPRFGLSSLKLNPDISYARMYYNGRITPSNTFRVVDSEGRNYIQSRIFCQKGDQYLFEFSPYAKELICELDEFDQNSIFDISKYIDKPLSSEYYEIYVNGRRLGLPNVFSFGPDRAVFKGLKSKYLLTIYEKERDFEYFGYSKIMKESETFFYLPKDLVDESFMTEKEINLIIDKYIESIKNKNAVIFPNELEEEKISFDIENGLIEEMKIFFFEELLPIGLGNPDELQFNKAYFSEVFPNFTKEFLIDGNDENPDVIFLNPDVTARIYNAKTNDYELIDTSDSDPEKSFVMLTGESQ